MRKGILASIQKSVIVLVLVGAMVLGVLACLGDDTQRHTVIPPDSALGPAAEAGSIALDDSETLAKLGLSARALQISDTIDSTGLRTFSSYDELKEFVGSGIPIWSPGYWGYPYWYYSSINTFSPRVILSSDSAAFLETSAVATGDWIEAPSYSQTNVQVEGIDEADIVKTDGRYIYIVKQNAIIIVKAYPAEDAKVLCEIQLEGTLQSLYISDNRLVVFENIFCDKTWEANTTDGDDLEVQMTIPMHSNKTSVKIYDVMDRRDPVLDHDVMVDGCYWNSRMVDNYVYVIVKEQPYSWEEEILLPKIHFGNTVLEVPPTEILHPEKRDSSYQFASIVALDVNKGLDDIQDLGYSMFLLESSTNMYVSPESIYLTCTGYEYDNSSWNTDVHRILIESGQMQYEATGQVPGTLLNQFSLDLHEGYFRLVTTTNGNKHNVYILDKDLEITGRLEDFAPRWEHLHSARFMGDRGYIVTFRMTDPLFVVDLSDPTAPKVLGELEITGYSDYLHPYDENHLIGIGKEATSNGRFQGVKVSLFDVSDVSNPKEIAKFEIGDRGTDSPVLRDHKALLFNRSRNLLVMPVLLAESVLGSPSWRYGDYVWQGAYVLHVSPEEGIHLEGEITHFADDTEFSEVGYDHDSPLSVERSLYIGGVLYTISDAKIKMNNLENLDYINAVELPGYES